MDTDNAVRAVEAAAKAHYEGPLLNDLFCGLIGAITISSPSEHSQSTSCCNRLEHTDPAVRDFQQPLGDDLLKSRPSGLLPTLWKRMRRLLRRLSWPCGLGRPVYREPFLDQVAHSGGATALIEASRSRMARIFRNRFASPVSGWRAAAEGRTLSLGRRCACRSGRLCDGSRSEPYGKFRQRARWLGPAHRSRDYQCRSHHGDADDTFQACIEGGADDDVGVLVGLFGMRVPASSTSNN